MKVIAITASKRKMNTYKVVSQIKNILMKNQIEVEIINLYDYNIESCLGCEVCILKGKCILKDDVPFLMDKLKSSDGIILSSPVYLQSVSGKLKTFVDRTCAWFHRPELYGKPLLVVATTKGSGLKSTLEYLQSIGTQWGAFNCGNIGRNIRTIDKEVTDKECEAFIKSLKKDKCLYKPSLKSVLNFNMQKVLSRKLIALDKAYWDERGWDKNSYYFSCKVSPLKKAAGNMTYKFFNKVMKAPDDLKEIKEKQNNKEHLK